LYDAQGYSGRVVAVFGDRNLTRNPENAGGRLRDPEEREGEKEDETIRRCEKGCEQGSLQGKRTNVGGKKQVFVLDGNGQLRKKKKTQRKKIKEGKACQGKRSEKRKTHKAQSPASTPWSKTGHQEKKTIRGKKKMGVSTENWRR